MFDKKGDFLINASEESCSMRKYAKSVALILSP
jgi:hypothetical protein